jgi:hypothetical protein
MAARESGELVFARAEKFGKLAYVITEKMASAADLKFLRRMPQSLSGSSNRRAELDRYCVRLNHTRALAF